MSRTRHPSFSHTEWAVILRDEQSQEMVMYNEGTRELQVQPVISNETKERRSSIQLSTNAGQTPNFCSLCRRPWVENLSNATDSQTSFMDRNYFRTLQTAMLTDKEYASIESEDYGYSGRPKKLSEAAFNQGYYARFFREGAKLGRGSGGSVFSCQHVLDDIQLGQYAVKKVPVGDDHDWLDRMLREVQILENIRNPHIIEYKHAWLEFHQMTIFGPSIPCLFILMQYANMGDLEGLVKDFEGMTQKEKSLLICKLFGHIAMGLGHLHKLGILHRDMKPSNILLCGNGNDLVAVITDFGESARISQLRSAQNFNRTGATGTIEFVAPELIKMDSITGEFTGQHSEKTDLWSLGMILYYMVTDGRLPYVDIEDIDKLKADMSDLIEIKMPSEVEILPPAYRRVIKSLLQVNPDARMTIDQVIAAIGIKEQVNSWTSHEINAHFPNRKQSFPLLAYPQTIRANILTRPLSENGRIILSLSSILISLATSYPVIPSFIILISVFALAFGIQKCKSVMQLAVILTVYSLLLAYNWRNQ